MADTLIARTGDLREGVEPGTRVEVRDRFRGSWARGFEVVAAEDGGFRIRRLSDGAVLPTLFDGDDVRAERRRNEGLWWYGG